MNKFFHSPPFTEEEERLALELYGRSKSLKTVARALHRSRSGIYKVLLRSKVLVRSNVKIPGSLRHLIGELYYTQTLSTNEIRTILKKEHGINASRFSVMYALERADVPIPEDLFELAGTRRIIIKGRLIDLLPFASAYDLRWVDDRLIKLRFENSHCRDFH